MKFNAIPTRYVRVTISTTDGRDSGGANSYGHGVNAIRKAENEKTRKLCIVVHPLRERWSCIVAAERLPQVKIQWSGEDSVYLY